MEQITFTRFRFAQILGLTEDELVSADLRMRKNSDELHPVRYQPNDLSVYRAELNLRPMARPPRRQLFLNFKGGTGKTSLSTSYAYRLAEMGHRVLVVDLDSQGHASKCLGYETEDHEKTLFDVLVKKRPLSEVVIESPLKELSFVPSNLRMSTVDLSLMPLNAREFRLRTALDDLPQTYEFIIMDAPPSFGLLNLNAIVAADDLFIPVIADFLSFHGLKLLFETVSGIEQDLQLLLDRIFVVINLYNPTTRIAREARLALEKYYAEYLLKTVIRQCTKFAQASSEGHPISVFDPTSKGAEDIERLIAEVLPLTLVAKQKESRA